MILTVSTLKLSSSITDQVIIPTVGTSRRTDLMSRLKSYQNDDEDLVLSVHVMILFIPENKPSPLYTSECVQ